MLSRCAASKIASTDPGADVQKTEAAVVPLRCNSAMKKSAILLGVVTVVEFGFGGEGVFVQPFQQLRAVAADDFDLRIVDMRINEAGHQNRIGIVAQVDIIGQHVPQCVVGADRADQALINRGLSPSDS